MSIPSHGAAAPLLVADKRRLNPVSWIYERLVLELAKFEEELDSATEAGARLVSFGPEMVFHTDDIGYRGPDMITFSGATRDGQRVKLVQHYSQLSLLFVAVPKQGNEANRIGFRLQKSLSRSTEEAGLE